jgi:mono/diheme cytochrome c family protein
MKILRALILVVCVVGVLAGAGVTVLAVKQPAQRPASTEKVERTPERLERGKFLAEVLVQCMHCHSDHDTSKFTWPAKPGTFGQGGFAFDESLGFPGRVCAQNITPDPETGLGNWTDGEIIRAIREGVAKDGHALFPMMPYESFRHMSDEDVRSIVVYLRSLAPIKHAVPEAKLDFPVNLLIKLAPKPVDGPVTSPDPKDHLAWGKYLVTMANCGDCHTNHVRGKPVEGMEFAGGWIMKFPITGQRFSPPNITPDPETGIGNMTKEQFVSRFKAFESMTELPPAPPHRNTIMPWNLYAKIPAEDLGAIYDYLRTLKPIKNKVNTFPDAT